MSLRIKYLLCVQLLKVCKWSVNVISNVRRSHNITMKFKKWNSWLCLKMPILLIVWSWWKSALKRHTMNFIDFIDILLQPLYIFLKSKWRRKTLVQNLTVLKLKVKGNSTQNCIKCDVHSLFWCFLPPMLQSKYGR